MRPLYPHDLQDVARALLAAHAKNRRPRAREILVRASEADSYRERTGLAHPDYGNGSLGAAARSFAVVSPQHRSARDARNQNTTARS